MMRIIGYGLLVLLLMSGCVRRVRHIPIEETVVEEKLPTHTATPKPKGRLYDTTKTESKYNLKPEPYSVGSKEKDPELLGPQRTVPVLEDPHPAEVKYETVSVVPMEVENIETVPVEVSTAQPSSKLAPSMSKSECISMIGSEKFERYSKRFGGESGALKRCVILKKLKG